MRVQCTKCGEVYGTCHCRTCCMTFTSDSSFDAHRIGRFTPNERRCMTLEEMKQAGFRTSSRGWTNGAPMTKTAIRLRSASR